MLCGNSYGSLWKVMLTDEHHLPVSVGVTASPTLHLPLFGLHNQCIQSIEAVESTSSTGGFPLQSAVEPLN